MKRQNPKENKYVDNLIAERRRANKCIFEQDLSSVSVARAFGYQEGINYAIRTFFNIYLGGK